MGDILLYNTVRELDQENKYFIVVSPNENMAVTSIAEKVLKGFASYFRRVGEVYKPFFYSVRSNLYLKINNIVYFVSGTATRYIVVPLNSKLRETERVYSLFPVSRVRLFSEYAIVEDELYRNKRVFSFIESNIVERRETYAYKYFRRGKHYIIPNPISYTNTIVGMVHGKLVITHVDYSYDKKPEVLDTMIETLVLTSDEKIVPLDFRKTL